MIEKLKKELSRLKNPKRAKVMQGFFKTGVGQYGEGDIFLGLSVPQQRLIAKNYLDLSLNEIQQLLQSPVHEYRFTALAILVSQYRRADNHLKEKIYKFYLKNAKRINNWDLVDSSAEFIVGEYLFDKDKSTLYKLAKSSNLWERRISIISTFGFIKRNKFDETFKIAKLLLGDNHDLIHKAVGWMLREVGKRSLFAEETFLNKYSKIMPRTALRYAIERMPKPKQKFYMAR